MQQDEVGEDVPLSSFLDSNDGSDQLRARTVTDTSSPSVLGSVLETSVLSAAVGLATAPGVSGSSGAGTLTGGDVIIGSGIEFNRGRTLSSPGAAVGSRVFDSNRSRTLTDFSSSGGDAFGSRPSSGIDGINLSSLSFGEIEPVSPSPAGMRPVANRASPFAPISSPSRLHQNHHRHHHQQQQPYSPSFDTGPSLHFRRTRQDPVSPLIPPLRKTDSNSSSNHPPAEGSLSSALLRHSQSAELSSAQIQLQEQQNNATVLPQSISTQSELSRDNANDNEPSSPGSDRGSNNSNKKLFVGQVPKSSDESDLIPIFGPYGPLADISIIRDRSSLGHRGCAFVTFQNADDAKRAMENIHDKIKFDISRRPLQVRIADEPGGGNRSIESEVEHKLFVGMLSRNLGEREIKSMFEQFGHVSSVFLIRNQDGSRRGCAFVKMQTQEGADAAIEGLSGNVTCPDMTRPVLVKYADNKYQKRARSHIQARREYGDAYEIPSFGRPSLGLQDETFPEFRSFEHTSSTHNGTGQPHSPRAFSDMHSGPSSFNSDSTSTNAYYTIGGHAQGNIGQRPKEGPPGANLFIYHLPHDFKDDDLASAFAPFGNVISAKVYVDRYTGESKGFGFVSYNNCNAAENAITGMNGYQIGSKRLKVQLKIASGPSSTYEQLSYQRHVGEGNTVEIEQSPYGPPHSPGKAFPQTGMYPSMQPTPHNNPAGVSHGADSMLGGSSIGGQQQNNAGQRPREGPPGANLFIYHLPHDLTDDDLASAFASFGNVISAKVYVDRYTGESKGFGFVSYDSVVSAEQAINQMNGYQIGSKRLKVQHKRVRQHQNPDVATTRYYPQQQYHQQYMRGNEEMHREPNSYYK